MTARTSAVVRIWRSRQPRTRADHAYVVYLLAMVALVLVVPVIRAIAMTLTSPYGITVLTSPSAPDATMLAVAGLWAGMLLLGRVRGPALRPPFLAHALAASDMSRMDSFRGPLLRGGLIVVSLVTAVAAAIGASLAVSGQTTLGVLPTDVVDAVDGCSASDAGVGSMVIVVVQPGVVAGGSLLV